MQAHLQFALGVDLKSARATVQKIPGVRTVVQVFPGDVDDELSRMYVVDIDPAQQTGTIAGLRSLSVVETLEVASPKRIRSHSATSSRS